MNRATAIARVCAAHKDLRTACRITNRTGTKCFAIGVFIGRVSEIENALRSSFVHEGEVYYDHRQETIRRVEGLREAFTRIYIEGWI
jgi:hypothetical protein